MTFMSVAIALHSTAIRLMIVRARYFMGGQCHESGYCRLGRLSVLCKLGY